MVLQGRTRDRFEGQLLLRRFGLDSRGPSRRAARHTRATVDEDAVSQRTRGRSGNRARNHENVTRFAPSVSASAGKFHVVPCLLLTGLLLRLKDPGEKLCLFLEFCEKVIAVLSMTHVFNIKNKGLANPHGKG